VCKNKHRGVEARRLRFTRSRQSPNDAGDRGQNCAPHRSRVTLVLFRTRRWDECLELKEGLGVAFEKAVRRKPLAFAVDAGLSMEFQSIFARKALPEAEFGKRVVIDDHRSIHDTPVHDSPHRNARPIILQASYPRISDAACIGHALASAAPAASF